MDFVHHEITKQVQAGHAVVSPLAAVHGLPKLCMYLVAVILQVRRWRRLIFDFTWSGLNDATTRKVPKEVMSFGDNLHRIIRRVLMADLRLGLVYLGKVDPDDA